MGNRSAAVKKAWITRRRGAAARRELARPGALTLSGARAGWDKASGAAAYRALKAKFRSVRVPTKSKWSTEAYKKVSKPWASKKW